MTVEEGKRIRQSLKVLIDIGAISVSTMNQIASLKEEDGKTVPDELVTRKEAMVKLKVSQQTLINYEHLGKLKAHKVAGMHLVRYRLEDIEDLCK